MEELNAKSIMGGGVWTPCLGFDDSGEVLHRPRPLYVHILVCCRILQVHIVQPGNVGRVPANDVCIYRHLAAARPWNLIKVVGRYLEREQYFPWNTHGINVFVVLLLIMWLPVAKTGSKKTAAENALR